MLKTKVIGTQNSSLLNYHILFLPMFLRNLHRLHLIGGNIMKVPFRAFPPNPVISDVTLVV